MSYTAEMSMAITKASFDPKTNTMKFRMVCSDTGPDVFDERMSLELFNDFTSRIENGMDVPVPFKSILSEKSGWQGGMPYISIAHYKSGIEGKNIPADTERVYVDGEMLKATAVCRDSELGRAVFKALKDDLEGKSEYEDKVRVSIGFLDLQHRHGDFVFTRDTLEKSCPMCENGDGDKVYLKGQLVHLALTRSPANPRTDTEVDNMGKPITTKREDAVSIVGESLTEDIEINKTSLDVEPEILTVKAVADPNADAEDMAGEHTGKDGCTCKACKAKKKAQTKSNVEETEVELATEISPLDEVFASFKSKVMSMKSMSRDEALKALQSDFELVAKAVQNEFVETPVPTQVIASIDPTLADLLTKMSSAIETLSDKVGSISTELTIIKSQASVSAVPTKQPEVAAPRNLQIERSAPTFMGIQAEKPMSIKELALRSVQAQ